MYTQQIGLQFHLLIVALPELRAAVQQVCDRMKTLCGIVAPSGAIKLRRKTSNRV